MDKPKLIVVLGPTACGKSDLGVKLAKKYNGEIVSADSRQIYRGMDLGTGKITTEEMDGVPHHMLDVLDPGQSYSVVQYQQGACTALDDIVSRGRLPFLVGGTGLYLRAVSEGYVFNGPPPDQALRTELEAMDMDTLRKQLTDHGVELNEDSYHNRPRLVRHLEKIRTGVDPHAEIPRQARYDVLNLGVSFDRETICDRIDLRLIRRLDNGMIEEVDRLRQQGVSDQFMEGLGLEYRYITRYLRGELTSEADLIDELGRAIKRFAKRQVSWFKKDKDVHWLDMSADPAAEASALIDRFIAE